MCLSPISIKCDSIEGTHSYLVPCGKCAECLKTRQNDYMVRIYEELTHSSKACFVTLTYSNSSVPYFLIDGKKYLTVWKQDIKDWIKRLRTNYERATGCKGIRYFLCSEYGPKTKRPHYHIIFFNMSFNDLKSALADWNKRFGFTMARDIDRDYKSLECSARYVSKYCLKGFAENPFRFHQESLTVFSAFFKRTWRNICSAHEGISSLFKMSFEVSSYFSVFSPFSRFVPGRSFEAEVC